MSDNIKVRVKFAKHGNVKYIGHLDMMRYFQKCMRKAGVPIAYSTGFSPHQIMSFAQPLGVGMETDGDYLDIEMTEYPGRDELIDALNSVMVPGVSILDAVRLEDNAKNAMASVFAASYRVTMLDGSAFPKAVYSAFDEFIAQSEILYTKETKKSTIVVNLKEHIFECAMDEYSLTCLVDASSAGNIKSTQILEKLYEYTATEYNPLLLLVNRVDTYMQSADGKIVPLGMA